MSDKRRAYEEELEAQMKEWSAQIDLLKAKADTAKAEAKVECYARIEALQKKRDTARTKLQELQAAGDEAWENLKAGTEKAWLMSRVPFTMQPQSLNDLFPPRVKRR